MNKIYNSFFDETYYREILANGLELIVFHKPAFQVTTACFGTPYGGLNINQIVGDKEYHFNPGIAHFLEHKLFETKGEDMMNKFSRLGANVNAFTSYKETVYFFSTSSKEIKEPLNMLMDFVQNLDITDKSVEKEKGIICEELSMYKQNPDNELLNETYKSLYKHYPLNYDIGGDDKTVNLISKSELDECFALNYHPSNMVLLVVTPLDPEEIYKIVLDNQNSKDYTLAAKPKNYNLEEPLEVLRKTHEFKMDINKGKTCYAIKVKPNFINNLDARLKEIAIKIYLSAYFTRLNPNYQKWLDEKIINDYFDYDVDFDAEYANIIFYNETDDVEGFKKLIDDELKKNLFTEELLIEEKRRMIGTSFKVFSDIEGFAINYIRSYLEGVDFFEDIHNLQDLTFTEINKIYQSIDYSNYSLIHICGK